MGLPDVEEGEAVALEHTDRRYGDARDGDGRPYTFDEADARTETNAAMAITTYISAVYSPASKLAGFRPHRLIPGAIDNAVDNSDTITIMAAVTRMK